MTNKKVVHLTYRQAKAIYQYIHTDDPDDNLDEYIVRVMKSIDKQLSNYTDGIDKTDWNLNADNAVIDLLSI